ncbi:CoA transferase [Yinghuangia sp. ASG 101]|uniref:CaiB/BaiF CoA transferase family protein n=1 Tax=Yinghuangia sp. ASG 101 TaxID=2896848 RepID=UPI001E31DFF1|nr:CoA transferase [Yinghuangia sp. ASG 101]UGQ11599.1 CoA transferase [Yinghuangia sp. ASG 101]
MAGPLDGLVVVDATWGMPGGITGMLLADYGARVVKVERPGTGPVVGANLRKVLDRGKWSVRADPATPRGRERIDALLADADVFLESFGRGRAAELGLDHAALSARHPHLVCASITGYGDDGPLADRPGYEALLNARLGMTAEQRAHRDGPIFLGHPTVSYGTGFVTAIGVLAALRARKLGGRGQQVSTSLLDGMLTLAAMNWWWNEKDISYLARSGKTAGFGRTRLITDPFRCADGEYLIPHTGGPGSFKRMMDLLGFGDRVQTVDGPEMQVPLDDDELVVARDLVPQAFRTRPRQEWLDLFHAADIAALPVLRPEEVFEDDQVRHAGVAVDLADPDHGVVRQIGPVIRFGASPAGIPAPAPRVGEHDDRTGEVARDPKWRPAAEAAVKAPLEGIRVVDFSSYFATGFGSRLLADLGADVVKVEPLSGDQMRPLGDLFEASQRGKRGIAVDMRTPEGQRIARELAAGADVVMVNYRPGKAEKIGLGYEQLKRLNPRLIYAYLPGFGSTGPKSGLKSFAPLVSGLVGLNFAGAGEGNPPVRRVMGNEDQYNGLLGAVSVLLALTHRDNTGEGQYVESPQLHSSLFVRSELAVDGAGQPVPGLVLDADQNGFSPLYRLYRTSDGWVVIAVFGDAHFTSLVRALGRPELAADERFRDDAARLAHAAELAAELEPRFASLTEQEAFDRLDAEGVPVEIPRDAPVMPELLWEEWATDSGRVVEHHHPEYGWSREVGTTIHLSETPAVFRGPSPALGQHTREVLAELGYPAGEIEALMGTVCKEPQGTAETTA